MIRHGVSQPIFQKQLKQVLAASFNVWLFVAVLAAIRLKGEFPYFLFPFLGHKAEPWARARLGTGFDALLTLMFYVQELASAAFGVVAGATTSTRTRWLAIGLCLLSWPYFLLDRTRNSMLVVAMPGILAFGLLFVRGSMLKKVAVLGVCFVFVNAWMGFIIANRTGESISSVLAEKGFHLEKSEKVHHEGLNMYEELCWINSFFKQGTYHPNWGARYYAEAANFIPRSIWPGKPEIGIDYAVARGGAGPGGAGAASAGVYTTFSTGMIGQGVVNFGRILGPAAAALLMAIWVAILAKFDLDPRKMGGVPLLALGSIMTFNMGRDITLIVLYPFIFSVLLIWVFERFRAKPVAKISHSPTYAGRSPERKPAAGNRWSPRRRAFQRGRITETQILNSREGSVENR